MKRLYLLIITSILFFTSQLVQGQQVDWVRNGGGSSIDEGYSIDVDVNGNSYVTGQVYDNGVVRFGNDTLDPVRNYDLFLVKYNRQGTVQWAKTAGGTFRDAGTGVNLHGKNLVVCGLYNSANAKLDTFNLPAPSSGYNFLVSRMDTSGNVQWVKGFNVGNVFLSGLYKPSITQDDAGNIYATGYYRSSATFGSTTLTSTNGTDWDVYVVKLDSNGTVKWAKSGGSTGFDYGTGIDLDSKGNIYFSAMFSGTTFTFGSKSITKSNGWRKALLSKIDTAGNPIWFVIDSNTTGTNPLSDVYGLSIDNRDQIFMAGAYWGGIKLDTVSVTSTQGSYDIWIASIDTAGGCKWITTAGGTSYDQCFGLNVDNRGNLGITGRFYNNATFGNTTLYALGFYGIYYALVDSLGDFVWAQKAGGGSFDQGNDIALDSTKNIYATGQFTAIAAFGDQYITSNGNRDVFVAKFTDCSDLDSAKVTYTGSTSFCNGDSIVLHGNNTPGLDLRWLVSNQSIAFATDSTYTVTQSGEYRLALNDEGCLDTSDVIKITVNTPPSPTLSTFPTFCAGNSNVTLTQGSPSGGIYKGTGIVNDSIFSPTASGVGTFNIFYVVTDTAGCSDSTNGVITVGGTAAYFILTTTSMCENDAALTLSGGIPTGGTYFGTGVTGGKFYPNIAGAGTHTISYTYTNAGCSDTATQTITVLSTPNPTLASIPDQCSSTFSLSLTSYGTPSGGSFTGTAVIGTTFYPVIAGAGTFTIGYRVANGSCADTAFTTVKVEAPLNAALTGLSDQCITNPSFTLSGGTPAGGTYYINGVVATTFNPATLGAGTHSVKYRVSNICGPDSAVVSVKVNAQPTVTLSSFSAVCSNSGLLTLTGGSPSGGTYYGNNISGGQFNPSTAGAGTHTINYTYTDANSCKDTASQSITVNAPPTVTFSALSSVCIDNGLVTLSQGSPTPGTYSGTGVSGTSFNPLTAGVGTHTLTYKHTDANSCSDSATQSITVNALPTVSFSSLTAVCINASSFALSGGTPSGGTYSGTGVSGGSFNPATAGVGSHTITYSYTDGNGCSNSATSTQVVNTQPSVTLSAFSAVCANSGLLTLSGGSPSGGSYFGSNISGGQFNPATAGAGTHTINYTYSDANSCSDTASQSITVNAAPTVTFTSLSSVCIDNGLVTLSQGSPTPGTYSGTGVSGTSFNPLTAGVGTHTLTYKHTNSNSCSDSATQTITVNALPTVSFSSLTAVCINASPFALSGGTPSGGTYSGTGVSGGSFNPTTAGVGSHTITYSYTDGNGCSNSATSTQVVNTQPTVTLSAFSAVCANSGLLTLSGGSPSGGSYFGSNISGGQFNPATAGAGTHTINYTYSDANSCSDTASQSITVNAAPTVTFTSLSSVCIDNGLVTLSQGSPTPGTYSGTGVSGTSFNPLTAGVGTHTLTYKHTNSNSCSDSATQTITVNGLPSVSFTTPAAVCVSSSSFALSGGTPSGGTYSGTGVSGGNFNPATAGVGSHTITYSYTDGNGCTNTAFATQVVNAQPTVTLSSFSPVCANSGLLTLTGGSPSGGTYFGNNISVGQFDPSLAGAGSHTINYMYTDGNSCSDTASQSITVDSVPTVTFSSLSAVCIDNGTVNLTQGSPSGGTYSGTGVSGTSFDPSTAGVGTHTLTYKFTDGNSCADSATQTITVNPLPTVSLSSLSPVCITATSFTLAGGTPTGGTYSGTGVSAGSFSPSTAGVGSHLITYTYTDANSCTSSDTSTQVVNAQPTVTLSSFSPVCANSGLLTLTGGSPSGGTYFGNNISVGQFDPSLAGAGTHTINYTFSDANSCSDTASQSITVDSVPTVTFSSLSAVCIDNGTVNLTQGSPSGGTYSGTGVSGTSFDPSTAGVGTHTLTYKFTDGNSCADSATQTITVNPLPTVSLSSLSPVCITATSFTLAGGTPTGGTYSGTGVSAGSFSPSTAGVGSHLITYTYTDANSCTSSDTSTQVVNAQPTVTLSSFSPVCANSGLLTLTGGSPSGGTYFGNNISVGQFDPSLAGAGSHTINYMYTDGNSCSDTASQSITVDSVPTVTFSSLSAVCIDNGTVNLTQGSPSGGTYSGTGVSGTSFDPSTAGVGTHTLTYKFTDGNSCADSATQTITVNPLPTVSLSSFSPVCITATSFTLAGGTPTGGTYSGTGVNAGSFSPSTAGVGSHLITYTYTDANSCTSSDTSTQVVNAQPTVTLSSFSPVCANSGLLTLTGGSPSGGTYFGNNISVGQFDPSLAGAGSHTINYMYTDGNSCSDTASQSITVDSVPTVTFSSLSAVCIDNGTVNLTQGSPSGGTYSGTGVSGTSFDPSTAGVGTHTLTYKFTDGNSCADSATQTITVNPLPTVSLSSLSPVCITATSFTLAGGTPTGGTYSGTGVSAGSFSPSTAGVGSHMITYTYTDANSCTSSDTSTQVVNAQPTVTLSSFSPVCANSGLLTLTGGSPSGGTYFGNNISVGQFDPSLAGAGSHTINYMYTDGNSCSDTASQSITVDSVPTVTFSSLSAVCIDNGTVNLTQGSPSGGTYSGTGVSGTSFDPSTAGVGTHTLTYKFTDGNSCADSATQTITVNPLPTVSLSSLSPVCITATSFTLAGGTPTGGTYSGTGVSAGSFSPSTAGVGSHLITYTYTDANSCTSSDTSTQVVNAQPSVTLSSFSPVCANSGLLTLTGGSPSGGTYFGNNISVGQFDPSLAGAGTHTINYTYSDANSCSDTASQSITVDSVPTVSLSSFANICANSDSITFSSGLPNGGIYTVNGTTYGGFNPSVHGAGSHTVKYFFTDAKSCSDSASQTIVVDSVTPLTYPTLASVCNGSAQVPINFATPIGGVYSGTGVVNDTLFDPIISGFGTFPIQYKFTNGLGCQDSIVQTIGVDTLPAVSFQLSQDSICANADSILLAGTPSGGVFTGNGVRASYFNPQGLSKGYQVITYTYTGINGCANSAIDSLRLDSVSAITFNLQDSICFNAPTLSLSSLGLPTGGLYKGDGVSLGTYDCSLSGKAIDSLYYVYTNGYGCMDSVMEAIRVDTISPVSISGLGSICSIDSLILNHGMPLGGTYSGTHVSAGVFNSQNTAGKFKISYEFTNHYGCTDSTSDSILVKQSPSASLSAIGNLCANANDFTLTQGAPSNGVYLGVGVKNDTLFSASQAGAGSHNLQYAVLDTNGCSDTAQITVVVDTVPVVSFAAVPNICDNSSNYTFIEGAPAGGTYSGTSVSGNAFDPSIGAGTYNLKYEFTDLNNCSDSAFSSISVDTILQVDSVNFGDVCASGDTILMSGGMPLGGRYSGSGIIDDSLFIANNNQVGIDTLYYVLENQCGADSMSFTFEVFDIPQVFLAQVPDLCQNQEGHTLSEGVPSGGVYFVDGKLTSDIVVDQQGTREVQYFYTDTTGCSNTASQVVTVHAKPEIVVAGSEEVCTDIDNYLMSLEQDLAYVIWNGDTGTTLHSVQGTELSYGKNVFNVRAVDQYGCYSDAVKELSVKNCGNPYEIWPNPSKGEFNVIFFSGSDQEVKITVTNTIGQQILERSEMLVAGRNMYNAIFDLGAGTYVIHMEMNGELYWEKIVVR